MLPEELNVKPGSTVRAKDWSYSRSVAARSLGWNVKGTALLVPDFSDTETQIKAARKRIMREAPPLKPGTLRRFRGFVRLWLKRNLVPLAPDHDVSFETWLDRTKYPAWRKDELREAKKDHLEKRDFKNKSFIKRESYRVPKHARWINSRSDAFKAMSGPIFAAIEHELYKHPAFIKHVPVAERSAYIKEMLQRPGCKYMGTDHTSFEAHFVPEVLRTCEFQLYWYMIKNLPDFADIKRQIQKLADAQFCGNFYTAFKTWARMSGDMCTSLGNGFTNLMVAMFLAQENGWMDCVGVVEGDDGLFVVGGDVPTEQQYVDLGFRIKLELFDRVCDAGFCGIFQTDEVAENLIDPCWAMVRSGWTMSKWMHGGPEKMARLSRAKAFSLVCEAPTCPITCKLALWIIRATEGVDLAPIQVDEDWWWMTQCLSANLSECISKANQGPKLSQRQFVAEKWGISIRNQLAVEDYFDNQTSLHEIDHPLVIKMISDALPWSFWAHDSFTEVVEAGDLWRRLVA